MNPVKVSYVVASYNHESFVAETLRSILDQTFKDLELIVVDDGSVDQTAAIAREIAGSDSRASVYAQENQGVVHARNRGVSLAKGEFIAIVDSDDLIPPERTETMVQALEANPRATMVYGDAWIIDEQGHRLGRRFENYPVVPGDFSSELFATHCFVPAITVMFRRSAFERSGPFRGPGANTDYLKWIELGLLGEVICLADQQLGCWRRHEGNVSRPEAARRVELYEKMREGLEALIGRHPELGERLGSKRLRWRYGRCHFMGAFYAGRMGAWSEARTHFAKAWRFYPSIVNGAAWMSTLPVLNLFAAPLYKLAERVKLKGGS